MMDVLERYRQWETEDFQNRQGEYPRPCRPDTIEVFESPLGTHAHMILSFKNTSIRDGVHWTKNFLRRHSLPYKDVQGWQDGEYENDWVLVEVVSSRVK